MVERARPTRRTQIARLRATRVKVAVAGGAVVAFGAAMLFARLSYAGAPKQTAHANGLNPPARFLAAVRGSRLQGGVVAPPQAPPQAYTTTS